MAVDEKPVDNGSQFGIFAYYLTIISIIVYNKVRYSLLNRCDYLSLLKDLTEARPSKILTYAFLPLSLIIPGIIFLIYFKFDLFRELEVIKILLISIAISFPAFIEAILVIIEIGFSPPKKNLTQDAKDTNLLGDLFVASLLVMFFTFLAILTDLIPIFDISGLRDTLTVFYFIPIMVIVIANGKNKIMKK